jgi:internalin A
VKRKQREYYVSYAWGDLTARGKERDEFVDRLCAAAQQRGIRILRDKTALGVGESISNFNAPHRPGRPRVRCA